MQFFGCHLSPSSNGALTTMVQFGSIEEIFSSDSFTAIEPEIGENRSEMVRVPPGFFDALYLSQRAAWGSVEKAQKKE